MEAHSAMVNEGVYHHPVVLFTKENMDVDKPVIVLNLPPVKFKGIPSKQGRTGNIQGAWDPDILVSVITNVGVPV